jgi:phosphate transport system permease protein
VTGTLWTTVIALVIAVPLGLGAAIYLAEYAPDRVRKVLKPVLEVLAGIPSVVYGFFALTFVAPVVLEGLLGVDVGTFSVLSAGLVLGIMIIPTVASLSEDAMSAVPQALRQGSYALGANKMRTTLRVVFPAAISGIMASVILAMSRAIGETMAVVLAMSFNPKLTLDPLDQGGTMAAFIAQITSGDTPQDSIQFKSLFAVALVLFGMTLALNLISNRIVARYRNRYA